MYRLRSVFWWSSCLTLRERSPLHPVTAMIQGLCLLVAVASLGLAQTESTAYLIDTVAGKDGPLDAERAVDAWLKGPYDHDRRGGGYRGHSSELSSGCACHPRR